MSDINLKVLLKYGFFCDRSIFIVKNEIVKFNGDIKKSIICFNNFMLLFCKKRDLLIMFYLLYYFNVLLVFVFLFFLFFLSVNVSYLFVDIVFEIMGFVVVIGLYILLESDGN